MVKINDRVYPVFNMGQIGVITSVKFVASDMHLIGGSSQQRMIVTIRLDKDGSFIEHYAEDVLRVE